ncbi:hypothetical protein [Streptomyces sp. WM6368]|uniref:hypothetical protein n=1 Tax=Streptomyces sp. WM6368 TaxID=1415554 RepID=UPI00131BB675|nr:hypothetical protein [Streptomyces sp. WM6368]
MSSMGASSVRFGSSIGYGERSVLDDRVDRIGSTRSIGWSRSTTGAADRAEQIEQIDQVEQVDQAGLIGGPT